MKPAVALLACFALAGCASTMMKQYVGHDIRDVILDAGPPIHALDLADGSRAFQYPFGGGGTVAMPSVTTTSGQVSRYGNQAWLSGTGITAGGGTANLPPCIISYITSWDPARQTWIVRDYRIPKQMFC